MSFCTLGNFIPCEFASRLPFMMQAISPFHVWVFIFVHVKKCNLSFFFARPLCFQGENCIADVENADYAFSMNKLVYFRALRGRFFFRIFVRIRVNEHEWWSCTSVCTEMIKIIIRSHQIMVVNHGTEWGLKYTCDSRYVTGLKYRARRC